MLDSTNSQHLVSRPESLKQWSNAAVVRSTLPQPAGNPAVGNRSVLRWARSWWRRLGFVGSLILAVQVPAARAEIRPTFLMNHDPEIVVPAAIMRFPPRLKTLWLEALNRPEAEMQRMAAGAMARGHSLGMAGLDEAVPRLLTILGAEGSHPAARLAAARTLVELDAVNSAAEMADSGRRFGADLRQIVEPALARWNYGPLRELWRARLTADHVHRRDLVLAIRCLTTVRDRTATESLLKFVHDPSHPADVRVEAARAAGTLQTEGLEDNARRLIGSGKETSVLSRLCAAHLVQLHRGYDAQQILTGLAVDSEPAVSVMALNRLLDIDPHLVLPLAAGAILSSDAKVRRCGAEAYVRVPDPERVSALAGLLGDPHPEVRGYVRESLFVLAKSPELDQTVRSATTRVLSGDAWRGLEQAALLLGALDHEPAAPRMIELVDFPRPEVAIAAAWGLKTLAIPETLPAQLEIAIRWTDQRMEKSNAIPEIDSQTAHLLESFGQLNYTAAEPLLRRYIPKVIEMGEVSRSAAIWSLGLMHKGVPDEPLAKQFMDRITDTGIPAEFRMVQIFSVVSIGRMKAVSQLPALRQKFGPTISPDVAGMRYRWALIELTGEVIPEPEPLTIGRSGWFLEPLDD